MCVASNQFSHPTAASLSAHFPLPSYGDHVWQLSIFVPFSLDFILQPRPQRLSKPSNRKSSKAQPIMRNKNNNNSVATKKSRTSGRKVEVMFHWLEWFFFSSGFVITYSHTYQPLRCLSVSATHSCRYGAIGILGIYRTDKALRNQSERGTWRRGGHTHTQKEEILPSLIKCLEDEGYSAKGKNNLLSVLELSLSWWQQ